MVKQKLTLTDDAASAARRVRGDFPGQDKEAKKAGEEGFEAVRATAQDYVCDSLIPKFSSSCTDPQQTNRASAEARKPRPTSGPTPSKLRTRPRSTLVRLRTKLRSTAPRLRPSTTN